MLIFLPIKFTYSYISSEITIILLFFKTLEVSITSYLESTEPVGLQGEEKIIILVFFVIDLYN